MFPRLAILALAVLLSASGCVHRRVTAPRESADGTPDAPPAGKLGLNVVSEDPDVSWTVRAGGQTLCTTPCIQHLAPSDIVYLESRQGDRAWAPPMAEVLPGARRAFLVAEGTNEGLQVNGIVFTSLGGMGLLTGLALTAAGCSDVQRHGGLCTAGLITSGVSLPLTLAAIWMIVDSGPRAHVLPVPPAPGDKAPAQVSFVVTPAGVAGTF